MSLNKKDLIDQLAAKHELTKKLTRQIIDDLTAIIQRETAKGDFTLPGIGKFATVKRAARIGRNPRTGEVLKIAARKSVRFSATKAFKDAVAAPAKKSRKG